MRPSRLRHLVTIQEKTKTTDEWGGDLYTWADKVMVWANVAPIRGGEMIESGAAQDEVIVRFYTRYRSDIDPAMRVLWQSKPYDITAVIDIGGRGVELEIMARAGASEG